MHGGQVKSVAERFELRPVWAAQAVRALHGAAVTRERHATEAGLEVLESGGNAGDPAVAVGLALAVTHSSAGNIGGARCCGEHLVALLLAPEVPEVNHFSAPRTDSAWRAGRHA